MPEPLGVEDVRAALGSRPAGFGPRERIVALPELPRGTMGEVWKNVLRERPAGTFAAEPSSETVARLSRDGGPRTR